MSCLNRSINFLLVLECFFVAVCVCGCGRGGAYWREGGAGLINYNFEVCAASREQRASACAYNSLNEHYIVVWQDRRTTTDYDIFAVILESYRGERAFPWEIWVSSAADDQLAPSVAYNSLDDEYLIVWEDRRSTTDYDIFAQFIDGVTGTPTGANFPVSSVIGHDEWAPEVVYDSVSNQYLVVWEESAGGDTDIWGQILAADGTLLGSAFVICNYSRNQQSPAVAFNPTADQYLVVWTDFRYSLSESDLFGQIVDKMGALVGGNFEVNSDSGDQDYPAVTYNSHRDTYLVVWEDWMYPDPDICAQELYSDGWPYGDLFEITWDTASQRKPAVCYNAGEHRYMVVWEDDRYGTLDICARKLDVDPYYLIGNITLVSDEPAMHIEPAVCANTIDSEYLAVWSGRITTDYDILGQLLY